MTLPPILWRVKEAGFPIRYDGSPNIVVTRHPRRRAGRFDDTFHFVRVGDQWRDDVYPCTADPGVPWMVSPMHEKGAARLAPGRHAFKLGRRSAGKGGYRCLVQARPVTVIRDADLDDVIDGDFEDTGWFGIQVHRANVRGTSTVVGKWSAGCVVLPISESAFEDLMDEIEAALRKPTDIVWVVVLEDPEVRL